MITSDTAIPHLAGALGVPAWVALKHVPDWRWMLERNDSPWYRSLKLFRQPKLRRLGQRGRRDGGRTARARAEGHMTSISADFLG